MVTVNRLMKHCELYTRPGFELSNYLSATVECGQYRHAVASGFHYQILAPRTTGCDPTLPRPCENSYYYRFLVRVSSCDFVDSLLCSRKKRSTKSHELTRTKP